MAGLGITMGDPAGVGPEIVCKALASLPIPSRADIRVFGSLEHLERANRLCGTGLEFAAPGSDAGDATVSVVDVPSKDREGIQPGVASAAGGHAAYAYIDAAVTAALRGDIGVIVTAPLNKFALHAAGYPFEGHTELLAHLTGSPRSFMLLASEKLSSIHVSTHVALEEAIRRATTERVLETLRAGHEHYVRMGVERPRIAVAGLNPHCGEGGLFGDDEAQRIVPAIRAAQAEGIDARGPIPGDTVFYRAMRGEFDLVVAQYHDQGHIPTKLVAFDTTVNVTLGLPIGRTSVDHGTAFDIAWQGIAHHDNMLAAIAYARRMDRVPRNTVQPTGGSKR
jgi:4-phospho-D-threonate 3-dehydrogenase / 4-phospho-D-erythronate 3-dehydrogenase